MSEEEPDFRKYFVRIVNSLGMGLLWLFINSTIGIGLNFAFFKDHPSAGNYIFYAWFLISLFLLLLFYKRKWKL
ncbi:MAG TPA: hypothetical protein VK498_04705 [Ferruginibacter sp.]|nr:hypothetical protein [Ferruginibacter sp.]